MKNYVLEQLYHNPEIAGMLFFDGIDLGHRTYTSIDKEEPGYFRLLLDTFLKELNKKNSPTISIKYLQDLHRDCTFNIPNFTDAGFLRPVSYFGAEIDHIKEPAIRSEYYKIILDDQDYRDGLYNIFFTDLEGFVLKLDPKALTDLPPNSRMYMASGENRNIYGDLIKIIDDYYSNADQGNANEKLKNLLRFIQRLERRHPFRDGNCRIFCMLLLNLELILMEEYPTLQSNPNYFDWMPIDALVDEVIQGQERFKTYLTSKSKSIKFCKAKSEEIMINANNWFYDLKHGQDCLWLIDTYYKKNIMHEKSHNIYHAIYTLNNIPPYDREILFNNLNNLYIKSIALDDLINIWYKLLQENYQILFIENFNKNPRLIPDNINFDHLLFFLEKLHPDFIEHKWIRIQKILKDLDGNDLLSLFKILPKCYHLKFLSFIDPRVYDNISDESISLHLSVIFKWFSCETYSTLFMPIKGTILKYLRTYDSYIFNTASEGEILYRFIENDINFNMLTIAEIRAILFKFIEPNVQKKLIEKNEDYLKKIVKDVECFDLIASVLDNSVKLYFFSLVEDLIYSMTLNATSFISVAMHLNRSKVSKLFENNIEHIIKNRFTIECLDKLCAMLSIEQILKLKQQGVKLYFEQQDTIIAAQNIPLFWRQELISNPLYLSVRQNFFRQHNVKSVPVPVVQISLAKPL